ncbi:MAG TPA: NAD(P)H-dependent glycerol-3-phosphate dehydrogenase, partial [Anaeromyxobacter sp.]
ALATLGGPAHAAEALAHGASVVVASTDVPFAAQLQQMLGAAGLDAHRSTDVRGVELAGCAKNAAVLAAAAASGSGANAAGAAAGKVFAEVDAYARHSGVSPETFSGLAGAGDLVATVVADGSRNRRAGELLASGVPGDELEPALGHAAESVDAVPLLAGVLRGEGIDAPALEGLAALIEGRIEPDRWAESITAPSKGKRFSRAA